MPIQEIPNMFILTDDLSTKSSISTFTSTASSKSCDSDTQRHYSVDSVTWWTSNLGDK